MLTHIFDDDFENGLSEVVPLLSELRKKDTGMEYIETVVKYILNTAIEISLEELNKKAKNISSEGSEIIMTIAEKLVEEGREEGKKEELSRVALKLLDNKLEGLRDEHKEKLKSLDKKSLENIIDNIFEITNTQDLENYLD